MLQIVIHNIILHTVSENTNNYQGESQAFFRETAAIKNIADKEMLGLIC